MTNDQYDLPDDVSLDPDQIEETYEPMLEEAVTPSRPGQLSLSLSHVSQVMRADIEDRSDDEHDIDPERSAAYELGVAVGRTMDELGDEIDQDLYGFARETVAASYDDIDTGEGVGWFQRKSTPKSRLYGIAAGIAKLGSSSDRYFSLKEEQREIERTAAQQAQQEHEQQQAEINRLTGYVVEAAQDRDQLLGDTA